MSPTTRRSLIFGGLGLLLGIIGAVVPAVGAAI